MSKIFRRTPFFFIVFSILVFGIFFVHLEAKATMAPQVYFTEMSLSGNTFQPGGVISGSATLWNYEDFPLNDLRLHFQLLGKEVDGVPTEVINEQIGQETFSLPPNVKTLKNFSYQLPANLPKGDFQFRIQLTNGRGEEMSWMNKVISIGGEGKFLSLNNYWIEQGQEKLSPGGGVEYQPGQAGKIVFDVQNNSNFTITAFYQILTYRRNIGGEKVNRIKKENVIFAPEAKKTLETSLPTLTEPGTYLSEVKFFDSQTKEEVSNAITFRWVIAGNDDAQILFVNPDKDSYQSGDEATVKVQYAGPAHETGQTAGKGAIKVGLYDVYGQLLGESQTKVPLKVGEESIKVPINHAGDVARIDTSIVKGDQILDHYNQNLKKIIPPKKTTTFLKKYKMILILSLAFLLLILILVYYLKHSKHKVPKTPLLFLFIVGLMVFGIGHAFAATEVTSGCCDTTIVFNSPVPHQTYHVGDTVNFSGKFRVTSCGDGLFYNKVSFFVTEDKNIPITDDCGTSVDNCSTQGHSLWSYWWSHLYSSPCSSQGCQNCYGAHSTTYSGSCSFIWCDQVKYLDTEKADQLGYKVYKLGEVFPGDVHQGARPYWVEYNKSFVIPSDLRISGPVRFYVQYSGTHWHDHWHWNIAYQKGNIQENNAPQAQIQCDPSSCQTYYLSSPLTLKNMSYDPDGDEDVVKTRWYIKPRNAGNTAYQLLPYCESNQKANCTLQPDINPGRYTSKLYVEDSIGQGDEKTKDFSILRDIKAGFMCSLDEKTWENCENFSNHVLEDQLLYLKDNSSLDKYSVPSDGAVIQSRIWKLNDRVVGTNQTEIMVRLQETNNVLSLTVVDSRGRQGVVSYSLIARPAPKWTETPPTK